MARIKTAVITGQHPYDVPRFQQLFRSLDSVDFYPQSLEEFVTDPSQSQFRFYEVLVFYNFHKDLSRRARQVLGQIGESSQGIVVLHHALLAFPEWEVWHQISGITEPLTSFHVGQQVRVEIADPDHPITQGLEPWEIVDETYVVDGPTSDSHVLLRTQHPNSMEALAWVRQYKNARVFCCQLGHDNQAYADPTYRQVLERAIQWTTGRV